MTLLDDLSRPTDRVYAHVLHHEFHDFIGSREAHTLEKTARKALELTPDVGEQGTLIIHRAAQLLRRWRLQEARQVYAEARAKCITAGRKDEAMRAAAGEARALLFMERYSECKELLRLADRSLRDFSSADAEGQRLLTELQYRYLSRSTRRELVASLSACERIVDRVYTSTRLDLLRAMLRGYARLGMHRDAARLRARYDESIRNIVANLESEERSTRFLAAHRYLSVVSEFGALERPSARASSVGAGTAVRS
jgi:hypothetical protein